MTKSRITTFKAWGGFRDDKLDVLKPSSELYFAYDEPRYAIFKTRAGAVGTYQDVRRIEVTVREAKP
jgi:hypothetical protein